MRGKRALRMTDGGDARTPLPTSTPHPPIAREHPPSLNELRYPTTADRNPYEPPNTPPGVASRSPIVEQGATALRGFLLGASALITGGECFRSMPLGLKGGVDVALASFAGALGVLYFLRERNRFRAINEGHRLADVGSICMGVCVGALVFALNYGSAIAPGFYRGVVQSIPNPAGSLLHEGVTLITRGTLFVQTSYFLSVTFLPTLLRLFGRKGSSSA